MTPGAAGKGETDGAEILAALARAPDPPSEGSRTVSWMLATIRPHECALLVTRCGVRHEDLGRHVRARAQRRDPDIA